MQRRLVPLAVAVLAVLAFAVAAGSLDTVASDGPGLEGSDDVTGVDRRAGSGGSGSGGDAESNCRNCGLDLSLRSVLADRLPTVPPFVLLSAATVGCGLLALIARGGGERIAGIGETDDDAPEPPRPATGTTHTTSGYDDPPVDNLVYRAWRETLGTLDVPRPATTTPVERAAIARERGLDPDSVATLTELFRRTRYSEESFDDRDAERARVAADRLREDR